MRFAGLFPIRTLASLLLICQGLPALGQQSATTTANLIVPPLVKFSGVLTDGNGMPLTGVVGVTFFLYKDSQGGAPLWMETQNVQPNKSGHYSVMLGSTTSQGLPFDLFVSGEARWLGVQPQGQSEQPRVLLLSVPYALKAGDAETVGGLPPSAFVLATPASGAATAPSGATNPGSAGSAPAASAITGSGTVNFLPLWTGTSTIGNSVLFQSGTGSTAKVGINTNTPASTLDVKGAGTIRGLLSLPATGTATATAGTNSQPLDLAASAFNSSTAKAQSETFQWQAEPAGNNTSTPSGTLNLLFGSGASKPAETGLKISNTGILTFASGQTFPGPGNGTITSVTAGTDLTGGGTSGDVTLSVDTTKVVTGVSAGTGLAGGGSGGVPTLSIDPTQVPLLNAAGNTFNGNQNLNGTLNIVNNATYQPLFVQSSSNFGTWLQLNNTGAGGKNWAILSAGGANAEGAGNLGITNFTGNGNIYLEGNVKANSLSVNNDVAMSSAPRMFVTAAEAGPVTQFNNCCFTYFIPDRSITVTRVTLHIGTPGNGCSPTATMGVQGGQGGCNYGLSIPDNAALADSGPLSISCPAGKGVLLGPWQVPLSCSNTPQNVSVTLEYVMQ